jgi:elongation factor Ts
MAITNEMIKNLRDRTGAGMMDCKRALEASDGNAEAAIEYLRKKGAAVASKRAERSAKEGVIVTRVSTDGRIGVIVEVNSETDFVGRSEDFVGFAQVVAEALERHRPATIDELHQKATPSGKKITDLLNDLLAKVGEKIGVRRFQVIESESGAVSAYTHLGSKIGVLAELTGIDGGTAQSGVGRDIAMQIAAMNPMVITRGEVDKAMVERELDIYRTQARNEGKPAQIVDRIATGKLEKFYQEVCLMEQTFIKDPGKTIKDYLQDVGAAAGKPVSVILFTRFHLGEEGPAS